MTLTRKRFLIPPLFRLSNASPLLSPPQTSDLCGCALESPIRKEGSQGSGLDHEIEVVPPLLVYSCLHSTQRFRSFLPFFFLPFVFQYTVG